jgi:MoCo/4Fe-4S cofactor protein with predicted Tat translocation signal
LDELAETPQFRQWVEREFPSGAGEMFDPVTRRHFVKIMSASFLLAGLGATGCRRPVENIYPFAKMPENYAHGVPQFFATAMPARREALPLVVKSSDGRPTKVEGNPDHPDSNGGTDAYAQASVLSLYDPDRAQRFAMNGSLSSKAAALDALTALAGSFGNGEGVAFLMEQSSSPSRARMQQLIRQKHPNARWFVYEAVDMDAARHAATLAYGSPVTPYYNLEKAEKILALDCDFIGTEENAAIHIRRFAQGRHVAGKDDPMSRLYAVESLFTLTGLNADHRLRVAPSLMTAVVARMALNILPSGDWDAKLKELSAPAQAFDGWIVSCANDLKAGGGKSLVMGGHRLPVAAHLLVLAMNEALGAVADHTLEFHQVPEATEEDIGELAKALNAVKITTLVILGGNPAYNAAADLNWPLAQAKAKTVVRLGYYEDETSWNPQSHAGTQWDLPAAHYLESWGDALTANGTYVPVQPLIEPLFDGLTELEVLAILAGAEKTKPYEIVREIFRVVGGPGENEWRKFLHDGYLEGSAAVPASVEFKGKLIGPVLDLLKPGKGGPDAKKLDVVFHRDAKMDDGRHNNNGWLQELPDPITKLTWDNAILVSPRTAHELKLAPDEPRRNQMQRFYDQVVEIKLGERTVRGTVWVQPGMADYTVGLALGYGRERTGRIGRSAGYNAYRLRTTDAMHYASNAQLTLTGTTYQLSTTQSHWSMEGRAPVREANLADFRKTPDFAPKMDPEKPPSVAPMYPNPFDAAKAKGLHQWGMAIDLNKCVGCSACMVACQSENNVPIVGKEMVARAARCTGFGLTVIIPAWGRTFWRTADPQAWCSRCSASIAKRPRARTSARSMPPSHDEEGLNVMVYNRCVGTRYCSNNCPYKVRRFNFFDYNRRRWTSFTAARCFPTNWRDGKWELARWWENPDRGSLPEDEWRLVRLVKNPDVSVRMRGVMEKCTFCLQRLEQARRSPPRSRRATSDRSGCRRRKARFRRPPASRPVRRRR